MALSTKNRNDKNESTESDDRRAAKTATTNRQYRDCAEKTNSTWNDQKRSGTKRRTFACRSYYLKQMKRVKLIPRKTAAVNA